MKNIVGALLAVLVLWLGYLTYQLQQSKQECYVNINQVYEASQPRQVAEAELQLIYENQKHIIDSLELSFNTFYETNKDKEDLVQQKYQEINRYKQQVETNLQNMSAQKEAEVWDKINTAILEYGQQEDFKFIYGASGNGAVMYADSTLNITKQIIKIVNAS